MWLKVVVCMLILVAFPSVFADHEPGHVGGTDTETASRFLSADAQRLIRSEFEQVETNLKNYQDENFIALDGQMRTVITESVQKLVLGVIGAMLIAGGFISLLMFWVARKYSYEKFLEQQIGIENQQEQYMHQEQGLQQVQQGQWNEQQQQHIPTMSEEYGQPYASNASAFNNWQVQPPYKGAWEWETEGPK